MKQILLASPPRMWLDAGATAHMGKTARPMKTDQTIDLEQHRDGRTNRRLHGRPNPRFQPERRLPKGYLLLLGAACWALLVLAVYLATRNAGI